MTDIIKVLIADDHEVVREGLRAFIAIQSEIEVVGEARDGEEAVVMALQLQPDVILLDLVMPRVDGIEAIRRIKKEKPDVRILILTSFTEDEKVFPAIKAGALGYLLKDSTPQQLLQAIHNVYNGESSLHPAIANKLIRELGRPSDLPLSKEPLTEREVEILEQVAQGLSNVEISEKMNLSEWTVRRHISNILSKLHLANRTQAALYALRKGIASLDDNVEADNY